MWVNPISIKHLYYYSQEDKGNDHPFVRVLSDEERFQKNKKYGALTQKR